MKSKNMLKSRKTGLKRSIHQSVDLHRSRNRLPICPLLFIKDSINFQATVISQMYTHAN
jgi:hypothetical protein